MNKPFKSERFFTNRENHFISFDNSIKNLGSQKYSILSFYGIGGVGKTRLKKEFIKKVSSDKNFLVSSSLDFDQAEFRNVSTALHLLYKDLRANGVSFPTFEIAHAVFWQKTHPEQSLSTSNLPFVHEGTIVFDIISISEDVPFLGLLPKLSSLVYKMKKGYDKWYKKFGEKELKNLGDLQPYEIERALPYYFAIDLNHYLEYNTHHKVIFFIDTYESLWENQSDRKMEKYFVKDEWLRNLIRNIPEVLWVILGREELRWGEIDKGFPWSSYIKEKRLGMLANSDADKFLINCDLQEVKIRNRIISTSKGLPFYLDLQVDTYKLILETNNIPSIDDFGKNYNDILVRFCKYLSVSEIETLKILSCLRFWDYDIFKSLIREFHTGFPLTSYRELLIFSFVKQSDTDDKLYSLHEIMRSHLKMNLDSNVKNDIHSFLYDYYQNLLELESNDFIELNPSIIYLIEEAIYHKSKSTTYLIYSTWLLALSKKLYGEHKSNSIQNSLITVLEILSIRKQYILAIEICSEIARLYDWSNDNFDSVNHFVAKGLKIIERMVSINYDANESKVVIEEPKLLELKTELLIQEASVFRKFDMNLQAYEKYQEAIELGKKIKYTPYLLEYSRLLMELGKLPEAEGYFYNELLIAIESKDKNNQALFYNELGRAFQTQGLYQEALNYFTESLRLYKETKGENHRYVWIVKKRYAESLLFLGNVIEAKKCLEKVLDWFQKMYGENYYEIGFIYLLLGLCEKELVNYKKATRHAFKCIELLYPKYGLNNREVINAKLLFCDIFQKKTLSIIKDKKEQIYEIDYDELYQRYILWIVQLEDSFSNDIELIQKTYGYNGNLIKNYFEVVNDYYELNELTDKIQYLQKIRLETERIFIEQFRIRIFENTEKHEVVDEEKIVLIDKLKKELGVIVDADILIQISPVEFYKKGWVYHINYSNGIKRYILESDNNLFYLDFTNRPIYKVNKDNFLLSQEHILDYVYFFFDAVKGRHGKFFIPLNKQDIPLRKDLKIDNETVNLIQDNLKDLKIIKATNNHIIIDSGFFFQDSLFRQEIHIDINGHCSMSGEVLILENLPIAFEPQMRSVDLKEEKKITNVLSQLEYRISSIESVEIDHEIFFRFNKNIKFLLANKNKLKDHYEILSKNFDDALFILNKYIKPTYDNDMVYQKEIGQMLKVMKEVSVKSEFVQARNNMVYNHRTLGEALLTEVSENIKNKILEYLMEFIEIEYNKFKISQFKLAFFSNTILYKISFGFDITKFVLFNNNEIYLLDTTNRPIYSISEKEFTLSKSTVLNYLIFFFDSVLGPHGKFYIPLSKQDIPYKKDIEIRDLMKKLISVKIVPPHIVYIDEDQIILKGCTFFQNTLFKCEFNVTKTGVCTITNEELILEDLPIAII